MKVEYEGLLGKERERASKSTGQLQQELIERETAIRAREKSMAELEQKYAQAEQTIGTAPSI